MVRPEQMRRHDEIDLKLGIKSSLPNSKKAIALLVLLWETNGKPAVLQYTKEDAGRLYPNAASFERLRNAVQKYTEPAGITDDQLYTAISDNPMYQSQIEALIVAFELIWRLSKVTFVGQLAFSAERTGGVRYAKELHFTRNMDVMDTVLCGAPDAYLSLLLWWATGFDAIAHDADCERNLVRLLTLLSEEAVYKMNSGAFDITFHNIGIYRQLLAGAPAIDLNGEQEAKGSLRVLKSALADDLNPYLSYRNGSVTLRAGEALQPLADYTARVDSYLALCNFVVKLSGEEAPTPDAQPRVSIPFSHNRIVFGAPGTGKSHLLETDRAVFGEDYERVTFHPNYSYAQFVGTYKPTPFLDEDGKSAITYSYVPGPFMRVLAKALKSQMTGENKPFLLIIEEINRAQVAAVFGDIFQLLDRKHGVSEYPIETSEDMQKFLLRELGGAPQEYARLRIPDTMYLWASMNSADQGVFPMDTAFKRRWDFEYLGIDMGREKIIGKTVSLNAGHDVDWNTLREAINKKLIELRINEDKLIGPFFLGVETLSDKKQFNDAFKSKLLMYLFEDAARQHRTQLFSGCDCSTYSAVCDAFDVEGESIFGLPSLAVEQAALSD